MKLTYEGPQPSRTVELAPDNKITVESGKTFEVDAALGKKLVRQRYFTQVGHDTKKEKD